jgi:hypothetical protein
VDERANDTALAREFVLLALRCDRVLPGLVDAFTGDPALRRGVAGSPAPSAGELAITAAALLRAVADSALPPVRRRFLAGQIGALRCAMRRAAGHRLDYRTELRAYFDVDPAPADSDRLRAAHAELAEGLPGTGPLGARMAAYRDAAAVPPPLRGPALRALSDELRRLVRAEVTLPAVESVRYELADRGPWRGLNQHLGAYRSRVMVNAEAAARVADLARLVAHEAYPGHHTERCRGHRVLVEDAGWAEHTVFPLNTPRCVISEGAAELGLVAAVGADWLPWAAEVARSVGVRCDVELAARVERSVAALRPARQDAAMLLHERGVDAAEVVGYLTRWLLVDERRARQMLRFLRHPLWRAYTTTYVEGARLVGAWLAARPVGQRPLGRLARLLDEPLTPAALRAELADASTAPRVGPPDAPRATQSQPSHYGKY